MTWWAVVLVALGAFALGTALNLLITWGLGQRRSRAVLVRTRSGRRFRGAWRQRPGPWMVLARAELLQDGQPALPVDGLVCIQRDAIDWMQVLHPDRDLESRAVAPNGERRAV